MDAFETQITLGAHNVEHKSSEEARRGLNIDPLHHFRRFTSPAANVANYGN
jgi:hypothetical protein